jgi:tRNA pseudouridine55 synthase
MIAGFLVMDKPVGITSHDVVAVVRAVTGVEKVGHTGTLDPFATGVLPLALGPATRLIQYLDEDHKVYDATIQLGVATDTGDPTGSVVAEAPIPSLDEARIDAVLDGFRGPRMQVPPRHSAVKVKGKPLYAYARAGQEVEAAARPIRVDAVQRLSFDGSALAVRIICGRGTYARVLAEEIAAALGTVGHLSALSRAESGRFALGDSLSMEQLSEIAAGRPDWAVALRPTRGGERVRWAPRDDVRSALAVRLVSPADAVSHLPAVEVPAALRARLRSAPDAPPGAPAAGRARVLVGGELIGIVESGRWLMRMGDA